MRLSPLQRIERFNQEDRAKEKLAKAIRKAIRTWKKRNNTPVGKTVAKKVSKQIKFLML